MSRFRLRFLLQEFDLLPGETLIGRSPDCQVTIEDPLISRHHAKIIVTTSEATYHDLGSRNGSRLNGRRVHEPIQLADTDRIRLGAQELVFFQVGTTQRPPRATGAMRLCERCATPFPEGPDTCPHCGHASSGTRDDDTMSGASIEPRRGWILQLLGEVLDRALASNKLPEAEKILRRAAEEITERVIAGDVDPPHLAQVSGYALRLSLLQRDARWVVWTMGMYKQAMQIPPATVVDRLCEGIEVEGVRAALLDYVTFWNDHGVPPSELAALQLARLEAVVEPAPTPEAY